MDIIIKSFNRPYYLERCIHSIYKFASGFEKIVVIDDGTPVKYLDKLSELFPNVIIKQNENHLLKSQALENDQQFKGVSPSRSWIEEAKNSSDYFLMIEDDVWFTNEINLDEIIKDMQSKNVYMTKIGWQGNTKFSYNVQEEQITSLLTSQNPKNLFLSSKPVMKMLIENRFKFYSILCRLGITNNQTINQYYLFLSISMAIYKKNFWLNTWADSLHTPSEKNLLINASACYARDRKGNKNIIARTDKEYLKTTYISSSTSEYHPYNLPFNINAFNKTLNEAWFLDRLDSCQNFPADFSENYIAAFLPKENIECNAHIWKQWVRKFKEQFKNAGSIVD